MSATTPVFQTRRYRGAGGLTLAADIGGDPAHPGIVFMHGGGQTRQSWGAALRQLAGAGYHVVSLEPGFGINRDIHSRKHFTCLGKLA